MVAVASGHRAQVGGAGAQQAHILAVPVAGMEFKKMGEGMYGVPRQAGLAVNRSGGGAYEL